MAVRTILMVTNNYFPYQGGVAQSVHASTQALIAQGYKVIIVTLDIAKGGQDATYVMRVPSIVHFKFKNNPLAIPWRSKAYLKKIIEVLQPDIIHTHHPWLLGYAALKAARTAACPVVFTYHTLYQDYTHYVPLPRPITSFFITQRVARYCALIDQLIAPSPVIADSIQHQCATAVSVIASPIRSCFFTHEKPSHADKQRLRLLYVGRFVPEKNITALLDAVALLPPEQYELDCVGYGYLWQYIQDYAYQKLGLPASQVRFHHKPDQADLVTWYRQADLFLFSSITDTQGIVLAEAMACGTPVIALDGPGQRSIIRSGYNGYIVQTSGDMAEKIADLAKNRQHVEQLSAGAQESAREYTSEVHGKKLTELYEVVIEQKARSL